VARVVPLQEETLRAATSDTSRGLDLKQIEGMNSTAGKMSATVKRSGSVMKRTIAEKKRGAR
jgi:hypothetical protein